MYRSQEKMMWLYVRLENKLQYGLVQCNSAKCRCTGHKKRLCGHRCGWKNKLQYGVAQSFVVGVDDEVILLVGKTGYSLVWCSAIVVGVDLQ